MIPIMAHNLAPGLGIVDREKPSRQLNYLTLTILNHRQCAEAPSSKAQDICYQND